MGQGLAGTSLQQSYRVPRPCNWDTKSCQAKEFAQGHTANEWQTRIQTQVSLCGPGSFHSY